MNLQTFRYAASGGGNTLLGLYHLFYQLQIYFARKSNLILAFMLSKPHVAALFISFCVTFPIGFFMSKYVVFSDSTMKGRIQLFRYFMICLFNLVLNYILLKILVESAHIYPVFAQVLTTSIVIVIQLSGPAAFFFQSQGHGR